MKNLEKDALILLKEIMANCKRERKTKTALSNKQLAKDLEITENYVSALESARAIPSVKVLLKYLIACGFDVSSLKELEILEPSVSKPVTKDRHTLIQKIYELNDEQVGFLREQSKIAEVFSVKIKPKKKG